jgi:TRAP-type C4-dicarboxylate transport system permease small subunit
MSLLERIAHWLSGALIAAMCLLTVAEVSLRWVFNSPIFGASEISSFLLALAVAAGLCLVTAENSHITVSLMEGPMQRLAPRGYPALRHLLNLAGALLFAWLLGRHAWLAFESGQRSIIREWPFWPLYAGLALLCAVAVLLAVAGWRNGRGAGAASAE